MKTQPKEVRKVRTYGKLREKIKSEIGKLDEFAAKLKLHPTTLSAKMNGKSEWTSLEIETICSILKIPPNEIQQYFFY